MDTSTPELDAAVEREVAALKANRDEILAEKHALKAKCAELQAQVDDGSAGLRENRDALIEEKRVLREKLQEARGAIATLQVESSINQAAVQLGVASSALPDVCRAAREVFGVNVESGRIEAREDGVVRLCADGKSPLTPATWLAEQKRTAPHWWGPSAGGGAGGGRHVCGKDAQGGAKFEQLTGKQKLSAVMGGGQK